jgi:hypothetical protein
MREAQVGGKVLLIKNVGSDRVLDHLQSGKSPTGGLDAASDGLSLFALTR